MCAAAKLSEKRGLLSDEDRIRIERLIANLNLPTQIQADRERVLEAMTRDKKREGDSIHFVLLNGIGNAVIEEITIKELEEVLF